MQRDDTNQIIENQCREMYMEKIKVMNMISNRIEQKGKIMELVQKSEIYLEDLKFYFPNFLLYLLYYD